MGAAPWRLWPLLGVALLVLGWTTDVRAKIELEWGGHIKSDLRFRIVEKRMGIPEAEYVLPVGVARNENTTKLKMDVLSGDWAGVIDLDFVFLGVPAGVDTLGDLSMRSEVDPFHIEAHALYIEALDLLFEGFDVRIGYQKLLWGVSDQFNPTNNLNADDLEDELLFGDQQANAMVRMDWTPHDQLAFTLALLPVFRPALVPASGQLALAATDRLPMDSGPIRHRVAAEQHLTTSNGYPTLVSDIHVNRPEVALDNMQFGFQIATTLGEQDIALNYFIGHHDIPVAVHNHTSPTGCPEWWLDLPEGHALKDTVVWDPSVYDKINDVQGKYVSMPSPCVKGPLGTETTVEFPRMQVLGFNMVGEFDLLGWISSAVQPIGYRVEVGVYFPEEKRIRLTQEALEFELPAFTFAVPAGEYDYPGTPLEEVLKATGYPAKPLPPVVLPSTPFAKWAVGLDYTFGPHVYMNVQWVHGLADEFGAGDWITEGYTSRASWVDADTAAAFKCGLPASAGGLQSGRTCVREILRPRLGDYLVLGVDFKFLNDAALLRLFTLWDLTGLEEEGWDAERERRVRTYHHAFTEKAFSAVIYPSLSYNFGSGLTLTGGALIKLGKSWTKFGDPAAGGSVVWTSAKYAF